MKNARRRSSFREAPKDGDEGWPQDEDLHDWMHEWRGGWHGHRAGLRMHMRMHAKQARWHARRAAWLRQHQHMDWHWRYRLKARLRHSLGARLMLVFLFLAALAGASVYLAMTHAMGWLWVLLGLPVLTLMAYASVRHMLSPLRALAHGAAAFGRGELSHRIVVYHRDEIGALARRFNRMADDIQGMLDAKRELLLAISHELRSPLTRARLNAELIDEGASQQAVVKELGMMRDLIESLLERERLDAGHTALRLEACDVRALVTELLALRFGEAAQQGLLRAELADDLPSRIELDRPRMQVLIGNLVDNALRHHDAGQGQPVLLSVSMVAEAASGGQPCWRLRVRDWGPGVAEDELSKLGQPFYRPDAARTRHEGGVGLGLNLCHLIVAAHGGTMQMCNAGPGLEASVTLPLNQGEA